jgi:hypothetical protein
MCLYQQDYYQQYQAYQTYGQAQGANNNGRQNGAQNDSDEIGRIRAETSVRGSGRIMSHMTGVHLRTGHHVPLLSRRTLCALLFLMIAGLLKKVNCENTGRKHINALFIKK